MGVSSFWTRGAGPPSKSRPEGYSLAFIKGPESLFPSSSPSLYLVLILETPWGSYKFLRVDFRLPTDMSYASEALLLNS